MSGLDDAKTVCAFWSARLPAAGVDACESETDIPVARVDGWLLAMFHGGHGFCEALWERLAAWVINALSLHVRSTIAAHWLGADGADFAALWCAQPTVLPRAQCVYNTCTCE